MSDGILGEYYGIDWATLVLGVSASYLISNAGKLYIGLTIGTIACIGGLSVAVMSGQHGFVVYNTILMSLNLRGLYLGWKKTRGFKPQTSDVQVHVRGQSVAANDPAPARDPYPSAHGAAA